MFLETEQSSCDQLQFPYFYKVICIQRGPRQRGCHEAGNIILNERPVNPLPPLAPPTLTFINDSSMSTDGGLYMINLRNAAGRRTGGRTGRSSLLNGFIFRIHDLDSGNITYIWQVIKYIEQLRQQIYKHQSQE